MTMMNIISMFDLFMVVKIEFMVLWLIAPCYVEFSSHESYKVCEM
jgi:hypothetical protein